jgi:hypothetical protein
MFKQILAVACVFVVGSVFAADDVVPPGESKSALNRIKAESLAAAHRDIETYRLNRMNPDKIPKWIDEAYGLTDFDAILHVHADDASHTGGTREELLADCKRAGIDVVMLSDHYRPPRDFMDSWHGMKEGVLFIPGSEAGGKGVLLYPDSSVMDKMEGDLAALVEATTEGTGMVFLSHVEDRPDTDMTGYTGMEIYNRHADAKDDMMMLMSIVQQITKPARAREIEELVKKYPEEMFASQLDYPALYLNKWDEETLTQRVVGIAANDCHHNQVFTLKMKDENTALVGTNVDKDEDKTELTTKQYSGLSQHFKNAKPGDELVRLDFDPYWVSIRNVRTHVFAEELTEASIRKNLKEGHAYVSHDWMADPTGFQFVAMKNDRPNPDDIPIAMMGDEIPFEEGLALEVTYPQSGRTRIIKNGEVISDGSGVGKWRKVQEPGVYRCEVFLEVDGEWRLWILSNPIYVR